MMKEKRLYQSPTTRRDVVELEDGFCGSIVQNNPNNGFVETTGHEINDITIDSNLGGTDHTSDEWRNNGWE